MQNNINSLWPQTSTTTSSQKRQLLELEEGKMHYHATQSLVRELERATKREI